ncbi:M6 family metalloprotease domain-containing protein [Polaribacter sp. L3A8]|uniref:M6 family metalloprotease domain-containing protein n=1 Tax=Polaribacter sp. L3A8 TaxID=2686361 RepID=UPI00131A6AF1|nr:M6 family metalloprotease domain-containing protein [Polaribacter sp. L3A8]
MFATSYNGDPYKFKQPDGTYVTVHLYGDAYYIRAESPDGYTLIRDESTGWISYAKLSDNKGKLISTGIYFRENQANLKSKLQKFNLKKHLDISSSARKSIVNANTKILNPSFSNNNDSVLQKSAKSAVNGTIKGLAIVVDFSDSTAPITMNSIRDFFNKSGYTGYGNNGSVKDFFSDISGGALVYENVVYGYYRAPKTFASYDAMPYAKGAQEILNQSLNWINNQGFDFNTLTIKNGRIQAINLMYTGTPAAWAKGMWYHKSTYTGFSADGVSSGDYNTSPVNTDLSLGTVCHENGHMLAGWPDTYTYDNSPNGIGAFDLMCSYGNRKNPSTPNPYFLNLAGWGTTININSANQTFTENSNSLRSYKYTNPSNSKEFYLIEPRRKTGRSTSLPDEGITIWHINENGNNQRADKQVALEHANNNINVHNAACWHNGGSTTFNDNTAPSAKWYNGSNSALKVSNVGNVGNSMSFTIGNGGTTGGGEAAISSPTPGSTLSAASINFKWNRPSGASNFDLLVGTTGAGSTNIRSSSTFNTTNLTVNGLPTNGSTIYVRLWTLNGSWSYKDYTYKTTTATAGEAAISSPTPGSTLSAASINFKWNRPSGANNFDLLVGTTGAGSSNIRSSSTFNTTNLTVNGLPTNGSTIYVRLWTLNGSWSYKDYTYKATTATAVEAAISSPTPGSTLSAASINFKWNRPSGASNFDLLVGTTGAGSTNIRSSSTFNGTNKTVNGLPTNGSTIYVRLWTLNGSWSYKDYTYKATTATISNGSANITSPSPGSRLNSSSINFRWNRPSGATYFDILVGTTGAGSTNIRSSSTFNSTNKTVSGIPTNGSIIYVRLWTLNGSWKYNDYTYNVNGAPLNLEDNLDENISIYPNPTDNKFTINLGQYKNSSVSIFSIDGRLIYKELQKGNTMEVDAISFNTGIYLVRISNNKETITKKLIIK